MPHTALSRKQDFGQSKDLGCTGSVGALGLFGIAAFIVFVLVDSENAPPFEIARVVEIENPDPVPEIPEAGEGDFNTEPFSS
ncbi:hypothetical protein ACFVWN_07440 [Nocardiopsis flavescens]|uniref:hypothetical protein n=1 Tax=Nocardiopsis flavescens TaxID=758803 RepID=UPI003659FD63